jgi:hypothetical protein
MPPRHVYWTILVGDAPTAFRAHDRADLLPTFERLRQKHPNVVLKYFARGRLWASPEDARAADAPRPADSRGREWRPGGTHRDPRDRFKKKPRTDRPAASPSSERSARPSHKTPASGPRPARRDDRASKPRQGDRPWTPGQDDRPPGDKWQPRNNRAPQSERAPRQDGRPGDKWRPRDNPALRSDRAPRQDGRPGEKWRPRDKPAPRSDRAPREDRRPGGKWPPRDEWRAKEDRRPKETRGPWRDPASKENRGPKTGSTDRPWKPKTFTPGRSPEAKGPVGPVKDRPLPDRPPYDRPKDRPTERVEAGRKEGTRLVKKVRR